MSMDNNSKIIVVGGGLVGALCASILGQKGYNVTVYEQRNDIRIADFQRGRSINLSLSNRGRIGLRRINLEDEVLKYATPMKGRMVHDIRGAPKKYLYDPITHQCIYSVNRNHLNKLLVTATEKYPNIKWYFQHKITRIDTKDGTVCVKSLQDASTFTDRADLIVGADGAFSTVRRTIQCQALFQFSQNYIPHGYIELYITSKNGGQMAENYLHIWPRGEFMMIALPNQNGSWTVTLFMSFARFAQLQSPEEIERFFQVTFPDAAPLIDRLVETMQSAQPNALISIKCDPYHTGRCLLIGDAAHAMVPFYGQGMNAGFEDCCLLDDILHEFGENWTQVVGEFSARRVQDAHAICDLAMYNYVEMRDLVRHRSYVIRRGFDQFLFKCSPNFWRPLYTAVTFTDLSYGQCLQHRHWQNHIIQYLLFGVAVISLVITSTLIY